jgi:hypothetical protein
MHQKFTTWQLQACRTVAFFAAAFCVALGVAVAVRLFVHSNQKEATAGQDASRDEPQITLANVILPEVFVGQPCATTIPLKNCGDADLRLNEMKLDGGCLDAEVKPHLLRSGKTAMLRLAFKGARSVGDVEHRVALKFGGDQIAGTTVNILTRGRAVNWANVEPSLFDFGRIAIGERCEKVVKVRALTKGTVSVRALSPDLIVERCDSDSGTCGSLSEYRLLLNADPRESLGRCRAELELRSDEKRFQPILLPVYYEYQLPVMARPERIVLRDVDVGTKAATLRFIDLLSADGRTPLRQPVVSHSLGNALECRCEQLGINLRLRVEFHPQPHRRFWSGQIVLRFARCALAIPLVAMVDGRKT